MKKMLLILLLHVTLMAGELISLLPYKSNEFSPALGQTFELSYLLSDDANVTWKIYTPDNNLLRTIQAKNQKKGQHTLVWDGKDNNGTVVPDEAYNIVLQAQHGKKSNVLDFRKTGGFVLKDLHTKVDKRGNITYTLAAPARVLVRAGIENGPMLRVISNWVPKNKGKIRQRWDMRDKDDLVDIATLPFGITVSAFALPDHAIITTNNKKTDYYTYFKQNNLSCNKIPKKEWKLVKKNRAVSKHYYMCRIQDRDPKLYLDLKEQSVSKEKLPVLINGKPVRVKVTMAPEDEAILEKSKYEVSFFVDFEFASEEELGFMPISWNFMPNGLKKGEHIMTVNVSSFEGQVGLKSIKFFVK